MHARVAIADNALDLGSLPDHITNALHATLTDMLNAHGRLIFVSQHDADAFLKSVKTGPGLTQGARKRWQETLLSLLKARRIEVLKPSSSQPLAKANDRNVIRAELNGHAELAVVGNDAATRFALPGAAGFISEDHVAPDIALAAVATMTPPFSRIRTLQQSSHFAFGAARDDFWNQVLGPLAAGAQNITLLDGYLFSTLLAIGSGKQTAAPGGEHVVWLLRHLDSVAARGATVQLITNKNRPGKNADELLAMITNQWKPGTGRIATVNLTIGKALAAPQTVKFPHDRNIRFSTNAAVNITAGFDRLNEPSLWDKNGTWFSYYHQREALNALQNTEIRALNSATSSATVSA